MKRKIKILIDVLMFLLFLYLLSYRPGMGLMYHAVIGITQLSLFILHHLLNLNWYRALFKGRYGFRRILLTTSDFLLLIAMGFMIASSVMISGMIFEFGIRMTSWWRRIHVASSGWCFLLTGFHVGMHLQGAFGRLEKKLQKVTWMYRLIQVMLAATGIYCFLQSDLWPRITLARRLPLLTFTSEEMFGIYMAIVLGMSILVSWILSLEKRLRKTPACLGTTKPDKGRRTA